MNIIVKCVLLYCFVADIRSHSAMANNLKPLPIGEWPLYRALSNFLIDLGGGTRPSDKVATKQISYNKPIKIQASWPRSQGFFCDPTGPGGRSPYPPRSVHQLRAGDIDIIGSLGDSLIAGTGALATNLAGLFIENKGVSWANGGLSDWRQFLTLPNILKEYNPYLYGYPVMDTTSNSKLAKFNVAVPGATSRDVLRQTPILIKRMQTDPHVDMHNHWKMITIFVGTNDFCTESCRHANPYTILDLHANDLITILRMLRDNLPKTIVNVVLALSMKVLYDIKQKSLLCKKALLVECGCLFGPGSQSSQWQTAIYDVMERWQTVEEFVSNLDEFHNREDFTVNVQPFMRNSSFPVHSNGQIDFSYWAVDCFHWSQRGYALIANALWNSLWESPANKSIRWKKEFTELKCPTQSHPFIRTRRN